MSYMNDDTDPFGVPYGDSDASNTGNDESPVITMTLKDYRELLDQKKDFEKSLRYLEKDIEDSEKQLTKKIEKICEGQVRDIKFERNKVTVRVWITSLSLLLDLKNRLHLKDIEMDCQKGWFSLYLKW